MKNLILLVEDDSAVLTSIQLLLESKGYNVETAFNGKEAIKKIENFENIPNLIISDISMPKMDGYQLLREVSKKPLLSHIPFIFLSGLSSEEDINLAKLLGADDYIKKPFKKEDLLASIKGKLKRYEISNNLNNKLKQLLITKEISVKPSISDEEKKAVYFFLMSWNKYSEPVLHDCYPKKQLNNIDLEGLSFQFFQAFGSISSTSMLTAPQDILVYVENIKKKGYFYFFSEGMKNTKPSKLFLLGILAPNINYLHSLRLKRIFNEISVSDQKKIDGLKESDYQKILKILLNRVI